MSEQTIPAGLAVTEPGVYPDIPEANYHADVVPERSLSCSGAKLLLPPSCPARFRYERDNPPEPKDVFDFGTVAHSIVLGTGAEVCIVDADDWRSKAAREQKDAARLAGAVPILRDQWQVCLDMADALCRDPIASRLLEPSSGQPEVSLFWRDSETNVMRRGRVDWLREPVNDRLIVVDFKTCASAYPPKFAKDAAGYLYDLQAWTYTEAVRTLGLADDVPFVFVCQEKTPPYLVSAVQLDSEALRRGRDLNRRAVDRYAECMATDTWPSYADDVALVSLPPWAFREDDAA